MFELEVFRARHGDALLLHYGTKAKPRYALIDGGPGGTWEESVKPRLQELRGERAVPLRWVMLSHVDDDHVNGLIDMLQELEDAMPQPGNATASTAALFHNTPGPPAPQGGVASGAAPALPADPTRRDVELRIAEAVAAQSTPMLSVASYQQGADLANLARNQQIARNPDTGLRLLAGDVLPAAIVEPLSVRIVSPSPAIVDRLVERWEKDLGKNGGVVVSSVEKKIQNLSSFVALVEVGKTKKKRILLTGDALDLDFIEDLEAQGLLDSNGQIKVDLLKLPHHGSKFNCHKELFETVKAKHYVVSGDGGHTNPSEETFERFVESEKDRECTLWMTYGADEPGTRGATMRRRWAALERLLEEHDATGITVRRPAPGERSLRIKL
jgi:hypothetical protein